MKWEKIVEGNIKIALHMGYTKRDNYYFRHPNLMVYLTKNDFEYHCSWEWLMPALQKIYNDVEPYTVDRAFLMEALLTFDIEKVWEQCLVALSLIDDNKTEDLL